MDSQADDARAAHTRKDRELNDQLRRTMPHGQVMLTRAIAALDPSTIASIITAVRDFDNFTPDNDPWGERDFGQVAVNGQTVFWKIDALDMNCEFGSPDPADESQTRRILTLMVGGDL